jgi:uncharacterized protein (TIGR03067 family)
MHVTAAAVCLVSLLAGTTDGPAPEGDLARLQGRWTAMIGPFASVPLSLEVRGSDLTIVMTPPQGKAITLKGELRLDEKAKPKTMDWTKLSANGKVGPDVLSVYGLEGDTLKIQGSGPGKPRPTELKDAESDTGPRNLVLTRAKDEPKADSAKREESKTSSPATTAEKPAEAVEGVLSGDLAKVQGKWRTTIGSNHETPVDIEIKGTAVTAAFPNEQGEMMRLKGELKLDPKAKPKTVDWLKFTAPDGEDLPDNLGIYELDGDDWKVCNGGPGMPRPTEFRQGEGGPPNLIILKRP